eukprot:1353741-Rhodomonas_salina.2
MSGTDIACHAMSTGTGWSVMCGADVYSAAVYVLCSNVYSAAVYVLCSNMQCAVLTSRMRPAVPRTKWEGGGQRRGDRTLQGMRR